MRAEGDLEEDVESAILDAELFIKYKTPQRAFERLQGAIAEHPRSIQLREKLREVSLANRYAGEAARQCLALANLYIAREDFEAAHERLLQAKQIDPRISIASGLEAIRRARRPELQTQSAQNAARPFVAPAHQAALAGDLSVISVFDAMQVIENSRLTGALEIRSPKRSGRILFNEGQIVGAETGDETDALAAFRNLLEIAGGTFSFDKSESSFPVQINASSNTSLILDSLREIDESNQ